MSKAITKVEKYKALRKEAKAAAMTKGSKKDAGSGPQPNDVLEFGTHAGAGLATLQFPDGMFGIKEMRPDSIAVAAGLGLHMFAKGAWGKRGYAIGKGGVHALITRWLNTRQQVNINIDRNGNVSAQQTTAQAS